MDLAELIRSTRGDRSYDDLARAAGGTPGRQRWHQLATMPIKNFPDPPTIRAIAGALGVTERTVVLASAASLGLEAGPAGGLVEQLLPPGLDQLDEDEQRALLGIARVLTARRNAEVHGSPATVHGVMEARVRRMERWGGTDPEEQGLAAMAGTPAFADRETAGEESQDPGSDDPA